jgi:O-acetyl-ADP-ribose deacetylase (regulator of RNase III)
LIVCFPTTRHWANPSKLVWIDQGLQRLAKDYRSYGIESVAIPMIGCGESNLHWDDVYPLIVEWLDSIKDLRVKTCLSPR